MEAGNTTSSSGDGSRILTRTVDQANIGAHDVIDKVSDAVRPAVERVASSAHRAVDKLASAAGTLGAKGEQLKNAPARALDQCRGYVSDNPVMSVGIAIAAGFVLSQLLKWRSS